MEDKDEESVLEPHKLCSLLTTSPVFRENALRVHYQLAVWRDVLHQSPPSLTATDHGWSGVEDHANITPTIVPLGTPLAPMELKMKLKSSKSTKGLARYDLFGYHDRIGGHLGFLKNAQFTRRIMYMGHLGHLNPSRKNYINQVTLYQSGCLTISPFLLYNYYFRTKNKHPPLVIFLCQFSSSLCCFNF